MGLGRRECRQDSLRIATEELPRNGGDVSYEPVNRVLDEHGFEGFAEDACAKFYAPEMGRPRVAACVYLPDAVDRVLRRSGFGTRHRWRCADSLSLREFPGVGLTGWARDYSTASWTRRLIDLDTLSKVFSWMLTIPDRAGLLDGKTVGVNASTSETNAAMRSIVRRDNGGACNDFLTRLAKESANRNTDAPGPGETGPKAAEEGLEPRLGTPARSGFPDHED